MATVTTNYNIKQITNYDIKDFTPVGDYITVVSDVNIVKLGYCCEPNGVEKSIYLETNGAYKEFRVGKNGIYEFQPESFNSKATNIVITGVKVPKDIKFTLDYVVSIN